MPKDYKDILLKVKKQISDIMGDGYSLTPAIVKKNGGNRCEVYFAYSIHRRQGISRPCIRIVTDYETGVIVEYQNANYFEFADIEKYPLDKMMKSEVPVAKTAQEQSEILNELYSLYASVRQFAYSDVLSNEEKNMLERYRECLYKAVPTELMAFCSYTEQEFFAWMNDELGKLSSIT